MALITDPDSLTDTQEITVTTATKKITLSKTGNLSDDGVTLKCVYSKLKELWKTNSTYIKYAFPMSPITDEQFEMINGWDWYDDTTRYLIRVGGWALKDSGGVSQEEWAGVVSLGSLTQGSQPYFLTGSATANPVNFQLTGTINQAVKVYGDSGHGNFDSRSYLNIYCREQGKSYGFSQLSDIGVSTLTYMTYRFPLATSDDAKITHLDDHITGNIPYTGMTITWHTSSVQRDIGGTERDFHVILDANQGTAEQLYEFVQYKLRLATDIDDGAGDKIGKITPAILKFVGDTLYTLIAPAGGTFIDDYLSADINRLVFQDDTGTNRVFPYTAVLVINLGDNLKNDTNGKYWVYFSTNPGGDYGTDSAILVQDAGGFPISGSTDGLSSVQRTFAYDTNNQGGRTPGTDAAVTAVAIGLSTSQFVKATSIVAKSVANSVSLVSALERSYQNPS